MLQGYPIKFISLTCLENWYRHYTIKYRNILLLIITNTTESVDSQLLCFVSKDELRASRIFRVFLSYWL